MPPELLTRYTLKLGKCFWLRVLIAESERNLFMDSQTLREAALAPDMPYDQDGCDILKISDNEI